MWRRRGPGSARRAGRRSPRAPRRLAQPLLEPRAVARRQRSRPARRVPDTMTSVDASTRPRGARARSRESRARRWPGLRRNRRATSASDERERRTTRRTTRMQNRMSWVMGDRRRLKFAGCTGPKAQFVPRSIHRRWQSAESAFERTRTDNLAQTGCERGRLFGYDRRSRLSEPVDAIQPTDWLTARLEPVG